MLISCLFTFDLFLDAMLFEIPLCKLSIFYLFKSFMTLHSHIYKVVTRYRFIFNLSQIMWMLLPLKGEDRDRV